MKWTQWLPILALVLSTGLLVAGCEGDAESSSSVSATTDDTGGTDNTDDTSSSNYPETGDFFAYTLDDDAEVIFEDEDDATSPVGETPLIGASLDTNDDAIEVLLLEGFLINPDDIEDVIGGELLIDLVFPNETGTHTDTNGDIDMLYAEDAEFENIDGSSVAYGITGEGNSSITITVIGEVGDVVEGSFDAVLDDNTGVEHTLTGEFRATRTVDDEFGGGDGLPQGITDAGLCELNDNYLGDLTVDGDTGIGNLAPMNCDIWTFDVGADGNYDVTVYVTAGDADLYVSADADFATSESSVTAGTFDEDVTISLSAGDSAIIVVEGIENGTDYSIEVTSS